MGGRRAAPSIEGSPSRVFLNEQMHWTLEATCSACGRETVSPLLIGVPVHCVGCGLVIKIDPQRTVFHRSEGTGYAREPVIRDRSRRRS
jgi:hypothetical protein